jgi:ATPase subunit of ABC transporter with duplicated ATPase domains
MLAAEADRRRRLVDSAHSRLSKKNIDPKDGDARGKINLAKLSGKDSVGAELYRRMENRIGRLDQELESIDAHGNRKTGIRLEGNISKADRLFFIEAGSLDLGDTGGNKTLSFPDITMTGLDRIALIGPNGSGKSTFIRHILNNISPSISVFYLPQELSQTESKAVLADVRAEDEKSRGDILAYFSRLGSDPRSILQSALPSPGEVRKLLIARAVFHNLSLGNKVSAIIMDEPTNHLDLQSVPLLEETLKECCCALLLVSHDEIFLSHLTEKKWIIGEDGIKVEG